MRQASIAMSWLAERNATSAAAATAAAGARRGPRGRAARRLPRARLNGEQPSTPPAEARERTGRRCLIEQRRPEEFERVGETDIRGKADSGQETLDFGHPQPECEAGKRQRQAGDKAICCHQPQPAIRKPPPGGGWGEDGPRQVRPSRLPARDGVNSAMGGLRRGDAILFVGATAFGERVRRVHILSRAFRLLVHPAAEWRAIAAEPASRADLSAYAAVLAAIPAVAGFIGYSVIGVSLGIRAPRLRMPARAGHRARRRSLTCCGRGRVRRSPCSSRGSHRASRGGRIS